MKVIIRSCDVAGSYRIELIIEREEETYSQNMIIKTINCKEEYTCFIIQESYLEGLFFYPNLSYHQLYFFSGEKNDIA